MSLRIWNGIRGTTPSSVELDRSAAPWRRQEGKRAGARTHGCRNQRNPYRTGCAWQEQGGARNAVAGDCTLNLEFSIVRR